MCIIQHYTISEYVYSRNSILDKIYAIDLMIEKSLDLMLDTISGPAGNVSSYELNDGQIQIKTNYRSINDVEAGIASLRRIKQHYVNTLDGRVTKLRDYRTFR